MNSTPIVPVIQLTVVNGRPTTTSLAVAKAYGKPHRDVLRAIRNRITTTGEWGMRNFAHTPYIDPQNGQSYPMFTMTKDGFTLLVQKFSGEKAIQFQLAYIDAFNRMEAALRSRSATASTPRPQPAYMREAWFAVLSHMAQQMVHRALARALQIHESTLSQVLGGSGKYGAGTTSMAGMEARVLHTFCHARSRLRRAAQARQLTLI